MIADFMEGRAAQAAQTNAALYPFFKTLFHHEPGSRKTAVKLAGWDCGGVRLPLVDTTRVRNGPIRDAIQALASGVDLFARLLGCESLLIRYSTLRVKTGKRV